MKTLITFDYELFSGNNPGTVEKSLLQPTENLIKLGKSYSTKFVFFVDVLFLVKLYEYIEFSEKAKNDYYAVTNQLRLLAEDGHDLQLHIHPQWWYSTYDVNKDKWIIDLHHFKVADCTRKEVELMFHEGVSLINVLRGGGNSCSLYRAGGYSFQNEKWFYDMLKSYQLTLDSSVLVMSRDDSPFQNYDYTAVTSSTSYNFSEDIHEVVPNGLFHEYPISGIKMCPIRYFTLSIWIKRRKDLRIIGDGVGIKEAAGGKLSKQINRLKRFFKPVIVHASIDGSSGYWLSQIYYKVKNNGSDVFVIIGHPKTQNQYGLNCLESYLKEHSKEVVTTKDL